MALVAASLAHTLTWLVTFSKYPVHWSFFAVEFGGRRRYPVSTH